MKEAPYLFINQLCPWTQSCSHLRRMGHIIIFYLIASSQQKPVQKKMFCSAFRRCMSSGSCICLPREDSFSWLGAWIFPLRECCTFSCKKKKKRRMGHKNGGGFFDSMGPSHLFVLGLGNHRGFQTLGACQNICDNWGNFYRHHTHKQATSAAFLFKEGHLLCR